MGVENFLDASTGHITYEDSLKLLEDPKGFPTRVIPHEFGWWIWVFPDENFKDSMLFFMRERNYSEAFIKLIKMAYVRHCWWINLDCDGDFIDGLEINDW